MQGAPGPVVTGGGPCHPCNRRGARGTFQWGASLTGINELARSCVRAVERELVTASGTKALEKRFV